MSDTDVSSSIPRHIAIIMDGNGRWATSRNKIRLEGHKAGAEATRRTVEAAKELDVSYLTLFGFSSENWKRPAEEVDGLMNLLRFYLKKETAELHESGVRLRVIGERGKLPKDIVTMIEQVEETTKKNTALTVVIALSYGGRQDITFAARDIAKKVAKGDIQLDDITEQFFAQHLMTSDIPDPDLLIRTSGEQRVSNFLMWQMAYAELFFTNTYWPDFSKTDLEQAIDYFASRQRRYGGLPVSSVAVKS